MRHITFGAFVIFIAVSAHPALARIRPGVDFGVNLSSFGYAHDNVWPISVWNRQSQASPTMGFSLEVSGQRPVALVTGLRYVRHGNHVESTDPGYPYEGTFTQHYLSMPVLLSFRPFPSRRLFLSAGPEFAVLLSANVENRTGPPFAFHETVDIKDDLEAYNISLDGQAGMEFPLGDRVGCVTFRYAHGLTGVAKEDRWASDWSTRGVEGLIGVRW